ncbi:hypothetical protein RQP46_004701 [Phenoliferia psychrophenolica]
MRAVIQRVTSASVTVSSNEISSIKRGLLVLVGIANSDTPTDLSWLVGKILGLRLFPNEEDPNSSWKRSVTTEKSRVFYEDFLVEMRKQYLSDKIQDGQFGAMMDVSLTNDGPVTILLDSREGGANANAGASDVANDLKKKRKEEWEVKAKANSEKIRAAGAEKKAAEGERLAERSEAAPPEVV